MYIVDMCLCMYNTAWHSIAYLATKKKNDFCFFCLSDREALQLVSPSESAYTEAKAPRRWSVLRPDHAENMFSKEWYDNYL